MTCQLFLLEELFFLISLVTIFNYGFAILGINILSSLNHTEKFWYSKFTLEDVPDKDEYDAVKHKNMLEIIQKTFVSKQMKPQMKMLL